MALGTFGSTLSDELNRLANGGTYRNMDQMVDEALAAKQWANREYINPYSTDTVGILNEIAGLGSNRQNWLDFNGVCNYIAGTTGLPAAAALRQVQNTSDLITSNAAYYIDATDTSASSQTVTNLGTAGSLLPTTVGSSTAADSNDPKFLDFTGTNYVYLPGANGNAPSIPDSAALDITGDIDLRAYIALDDWTPSGNGAIIDKRETGSSGYSYTLRINTTGTLRLDWSADGTTQLNATSTVATGVADGTAKWVRATLDVDNGASGNDVKFYLSDDGTTWTQLGTTVTTAGTTSIYSGSGNVLLGGSPLGSFFITGKYYRAQIFNGIGGTKVLDVDTSVITAGSATSFTAVTGQTVTINRATTGRKAVAVTQPVWLFGTDDYMEVNNRYISTSTPCLYLPGINSNTASAPDSAALDITGDIDIRVKVALDDWTPSATQYFVSKAASGSGNWSYYMGINTNGTIVLGWSATGSALISRNSTVAPTVADGGTLWVRGVLDVDNGAGGHNALFYTSADGTNWTQLGTTVTTAGTTSIFSGNSALEVGAFASAGAVRGEFYRAQVRNGIDGTVAFDANFETSITSLLQTSFTESSANAATVTINRSGSTYRSAGITTSGYLYPGATNTFQASATSFFDFGASDSFTVLMAFRPWTTISTGNVLLGHGRNSNSVTSVGKRYVIRNGPSNTAYVVLDDGTNVDQTESAVILTSGTLSTIAEVVTASTLQGILNGSASASSTRNAGDLNAGSNAFYSLSIGGIGTAYTDMELYGVAIFRSALTLAQARQISNYFANREVYL